MLGWLFGRRKVKLQPKLERLFDHDDLAAEFFVMDYDDRFDVLEFIGVPNPDAILDAAKPCFQVKSLITWRRSQGAFMDVDRFLNEIALLVNAERTDTIRGVFQNIFMNPKDAEDPLLHRKLKRRRF